MSLDLHPRTLRSNIWRGLIYASDQEIIDGMYFYTSAHGLCRLFSSIYSTPAHPLSPSHIAGIYAALSPMNTWDTNVANILDILRDWSSATVNTTDINFHKALAIRCGSDPLGVLQGRKVRAFYNCISNPDDISIPSPIDRHLINLALGTIPTKSEQSRLASNPTIYSKVEAAYQYLGRREEIGNRLASIAWFVQRRIARSGQIAFYHPSSPVCCDRPMWTQGSTRFQCGICKRTRARQYQSNLKPKRSLPDTILTDFAIPRNILSINDRGRLIIYLGVGHRYARSGGVNYLARYIVESHLGHRLRTDEHVHHHNGIQSDCRLSNLEVWLAERHGRYHARTQLLYMFRDDKGRFAPSQVPAYSDQLLDSDLSVQFDGYHSLSAPSLSYDPIPF